jgi:hypothetical protein
MISLLGTWMSSLRQSTLAIPERLTLIPSMEAPLGMMVSFSMLTVCNSMAIFVVTAQNYTNFPDAGIFLHLFSIVLPPNLET